METLVAVDLGLRTGICVWRRGGPGSAFVVSYRSTHVGSRRALKSLARGVIAQHPMVVAVVVEGDRQMGEMWHRTANRQGARALDVSPERWRSVLFQPRERQPAATAKAIAVQRADEVIRWSRTIAGRDAAANPTGPLRHDTADAVMIGLWACLELGWLEPREVPFPLPRTGG
ncbi:hypothetical protein [Euzebya tangerina]|uniref:hypothetical protein n=1 Tax=Euzebya tangerina TaxID=591198 RepID=UPI000E30EA5C|nr:hypothetical protein [Euzebya tangerina]